MGVVNGPGSSVVGNVVLWNDTTGTTVSDSGKTLSISGLSDANYQTSPYSNLILGQNVALTSGATQNVFIGDNAGATAANSTSTTSYNTAIGYYSLSALTSGNSNIGVGSITLRALTTGSQNAAIGYSTLSATTTGANNVGVGHNCLLSNVTGGRNIAIGGSTLTNVNGSSGAGSSNIAIGTAAGNTLTTGSSNILIGDAVDVPSASTSNYLNIGGAITGDMTTGPALMNGFTGTTQSTGDSSTKIATTAFVQNVVGAITAGLDSRPSCRVATTAALTATYSNGSSGVGATLTNSGTQAAISIDGVSLAANDRVLVKNQATAAQNGIYTVTTVGSGSTNWVLTRATDFNSASDTGVVEGAFTIIEEGTSNAGSLWIETGAGPFTIGTTAITFTQLQVANAPRGQNHLTSFTTSGTSTFTTSANITSSTIFKFIVTAGGGGGGGTGAGTHSTASGGGAGGTAIYSVSGLSPSTGYTVTVGTFGSAGSNTGGNGGVGGSSSIVIGATTVTASGGQGGKGSNDTAQASYPGGDGGSTTNGTINIKGGGGGAATGNSTTTWISGGGGGSYWGGGGFGQGANGSALSGQSGSAFGAGGGGAAGPSQPGGQAAKGIVTVEWIE
jgi:hypothetical protein